MHDPRLVFVGGAFLLGLLLPVSPLSAQTGTGPTTGRAEATPTIRVGGTLFTDYTVQPRPKATDADGNQITPNAFTVSRAYINVTGSISRRIGFRLTPDIVRESGTGSSVTGSQVLRIKYAYGQLNLDGWASANSWVRLGLQQTPWVEFMEGVYRYRFQGTIFEDREGYLSSADAGVSMRSGFGGAVGEIHAGVYNGEGSTRPEVNDQKGFMVRATVRPLRAHPVLRGLRVTGFYDKDAYVARAERRRAIAALTFEHPSVHAAASYLAATDQVRAAADGRDARGFSVWLTPRLKNGWEGLVRLDHLRQDQVTVPMDGTRTRTIAGIARWLPPKGGVTAAMLFDVENVHNDGYVPVRPLERRWAFHTLINF